MSSPNAAMVVEVESLTKVYRSARRGPDHDVVALERVSLQVPRGQTMALVGESGSGKSTLARCVMGLTMPTSGRVLVNGIDMSGRSGSRMREIRRKIQIIFQDPRASFDPRMSLGRSLTEPLRVHRIGDKSSRLASIAHMLDSVGLDETALRRHPHEFSGGQLQRLAIARALVLDPEVLVCDEPVSALDVSIQAQILTLLRDLQARIGISYLFIAHDLAVVREISQLTSVILNGRIVEQGATADILNRPEHEYTKTLIDASLSPTFGAFGRKGGNQ